MEGNTDLDEWLEIDVGVGVGCNLIADEDVTMDELDEDGNDDASALLVGVGCNAIGPGITADSVCNNIGLCEDGVGLVGVTVDPINGPARRGATKAPSAKLKWRACINGADFFPHIRRHTTLAPESGKEENKFKIKIMLLKNKC